MMLDNVLLQIRGLSKTYEKNVFALSGVNLDIHKGRIVGLLGQNGAGKSTLVRCVLGLLHYEGAISIFGQEVYQNRMALMHDVAFISDVALLPSWMTVEEIVRLTDDLHPNFDSEKALNILRHEEVPLHHVFLKLSKGNKTIVHLTIVLSIQAKLYVLDEPFLGLDINRRRRFLQRLMKDVHDAGRTVLLSTHQIEEVEPILTDLILIDQGRCLFSDTIEGMQSVFTTLSIEKSQVACMQGLMKPLWQYEHFDREVYIYEGLDAKDIPKEAEVLKTSLSDLFVAKVDHQRGEV